MTDSLELMFLRVSAATGRPWPTDPWKRARARALFSIATAQRFMTAVEGKAAEIVALHAKYEAAQAEARELLEQVDAWADVAERYAAIDNAWTEARR